MGWLGVMIELIPAIVQSLVMLHLYILNSAKSILSIPYGALHCSFEC